MERTGARFMAEVGLDLELRHSNSGARVCSHYFPARFIISAEQSMCTTLCVF